MKRKTASVLLGLPAAFLLGSLLRPELDGLAPPHPPIKDISPVVAVVDVGRVRQSYPRARALEDKLKADKDAIDLELRKTKEAIDKLKLELSGWTPFSKQWIAARQEVDAAERGLESRAEMENRRLLIDQLKNRQLLYDDIDRAVRDLAKKQKLQLVLKMLPEVPDTAELDRRVAMWAAKMVFYYDEKLDLTDQVIKSLKSPAFAGGDPTKPENGK